MIVTFPNGSTQQMPFAPGNCTGYVADSIQLEADDVATMRALARNNPEDFDGTMLQLENRFQARRAGAGALPDGVSAVEVLLWCVITGAVLVAMMVGAFVGAANHRKSEDSRFAVAAGIAALSIPGILSMEYSPATFVFKTVTADAKGDHLLESYGVPVALPWGDHWHVTDTKHGVVISYPCNNHPDPDGCARQLAEAIEHLRVTDATVNASVHTPLVTDDHRVLVVYPQPAS